MKQTKKEKLLYPNINQNLPKIHYLKNSSVIEKIKD